MITKNQIIEGLFKNEEINKLIDKTDKNYAHDLRSELMLCLLEMSDQFIIDLFTKGELLYYAIRILKRMDKSLLHPFTKTFKPLLYKKVLREKQLKNFSKWFGVSNHDDTLFIPIPKEFQEPCDSNFELSITDQAKEIITTFLMYLRKLKPKECFISLQHHGIKWYDQHLLKEYLAIGSYRAMERKIGINHETIFKANKKTFNKLIALSYEIANSKIPS